MNIIHSLNSGKLLWLCSVYLFKWHIKFVGYLMPNPTLLKNSSSTIKPITEAFMNISGEFYTYTTGPIYSRLTRQSFS